jgi:uncharacterized protein (DUF305 family)
MRISSVFLLALVLGLSACAGRSTSAPATAPQPQMASGAERARLDSLRYPYTDGDIAFMRGMIQHHAQAVMISRWAPSHGASPAVQRLTARIINAQQDEIALMQKWLEDRNKAAPKVDSTGTVTGMPEDEHAGHEMPGGHGGHEGMPGMLTMAQLATLDAARGEEFDTLFLQYMIQHHRGAVLMVRDLLSQNGSGQDETIFKFAADVEVDQSTEIRRMLQMLLELGGIPPN